MDLLKSILPEAKGILPYHMLIVGPFSSFNGPTLN